MRLMLHTLLESGIFHSTDVKTAMVLYREGLIQNLILIRQKLILIRYSAKKLKKNFS
jgi:hypothetical protein